MNKMRASKSADDLDREINRMTNETLASTRRMVNYLEEANDTGVKTLITLDDQGAQLERVEGELTIINEDMRETEKHLNKFEKCCGLFTLPWNRRKRYEKARETKTDWHKASRRKAVVKEQPRILARHRSRSERRPSGIGYISRILNDEREEEMDQNLYAVNAIIGNLHNMALDMHAEITQQDQLIDRVADLVDSNKSRMDDTNKHVSRLISE